MTNTKIITVTSASGGTGKTTCALALANQLAQTQNVLYINTETLQVVPQLQHVHDLAFYKYIAQDVLSSEILQQFIQRGQYDYLPLFYRSLPGLQLEQLIFLSIIQTLSSSQTYAFIVVDTDHIVNTFKAKLLAMSQHIVLTYRLDDVFEKEKYTRWIAQFQLDSTIHKMGMPTRTTTVESVQSSIVLTQICDRLMTNG